MTQLYPESLALPRQVLRAVITINLLVGAFIFALLVASLIARDSVMGALGVRDIANSAPLILGMRAIMVIGVLAVGFTHNVLTQLRDIVDTVRAGNPFVLSNASRLRAIAWMVCGLELMHVAVFAIAAGTQSVAAPLDIKWTLSLTRWLTVLLLFVLARVFEQGTQMREDLEGTV